VEEDDDDDDEVGGSIRNDNAFYMTTNHRAYLLLPSDYCGDDIIRPIPDVDHGRGVVGAMIGGRKRGDMVSYRPGGTHCLPPGVGVVFAAQTVIFVALSLYMIRNPYTCGVMFVHFILFFLRERGREREQKTHTSPTAPKTTQTSLRAPRHLHVWQ
jgi:hypothetical protein